MALYYSENSSIRETVLLIQEFPQIYSKSGDGLRSCEWPRESRDLRNFDPFFSGKLPDETAVFLFIINPSSIKLDCNTEQYTQDSPRRGIFAVFWR